MRGQRELLVSRRRIGSQQVRRARLGRHDARHRSDLRDSAIRVEGRERNNGPASDSPPSLQLLRVNRQHAPFVRSSIQALPAQDMAVAAIDADRPMPLAPLQAAPTGKVLGLYRGLAMLSREVAAHRASRHAVQLQSTRLAPCPAVALKRPQQFG